MPSYDIIPLASDLLDYTIQRVKQKEAEYKPVKPTSWWVTSLWKSSSMTR